MERLIIDIVLSKAIGRGGLERVLIIISQKLQARGHRVRVFQFSKPDYLEWAESLPEIHYYNNSTATSVQGQSADLVEQHIQGYYEKLTAVGLPDVILATHTPLLSYICRMALARIHTSKDVPIISWLHGPPEAYGGSGEELKLSDAHLAISKGVGEKINRLVKSESPIFYVGNPLTIEEKLITRPPNTVDLLYVGRLDNREKRLDILFQALAHLVGSWSITIKGDGLDQLILRKLVKQLGIEEKVKWAGWQDNPWGDIDRASLLVLSSDYEGFGMVLIEALARGVPVLSTSTDGPKEIVFQNENGWLTPTGEYRELLKYLQKIVDRELDLPSAERCKQSVSHFSTDEVVSRFEYAIDTVMAFKTKKAIGTSPHSMIIEEVKQLIVSLIESSQLDAAEELLSKHDIYECNDSEFFSIAATLYYMKGDYEKALEYSLEAYKINPLNVDNQYNLGLIYQQLNDNRAMFYYQQALIYCLDDVELQKELRNRVRNLIFKKGLG